MSDQVAQPEISQHLELYNAGLKQADNGLVLCRTLRVEMAGCVSQREFLAKLYCVRMALVSVFTDADTRNTFTRMGREIVGNLLIRGRKDPNTFYDSYDEMIRYVNDRTHWAQIEDELRNRKVECFTFYDIVLDFMLMDGLDFLENPCADLTNVMGYVPDFLLETSISTAVMMYFRTMRATLMYADGFRSRFYSISETVTPLMAYGFLGPNSELKELCLYFKDLVLGFIRDMFSFQECRYTSVEALAEDIVTLARQRCEQAAVRLRV